MKKRTFIEWALLPFAIVGYIVLTVLHECFNMGNRVVWAIYRSISAVNNGLYSAQSFFADKVD